MRLQLSELQDNDKKAKALRGFAGFPEDWKDVKGVLQ